MACTTVESNMLAVNCHMLTDRVASAVHEKSNTARLLGGGAILCTHTD